MASNRGPGAIGGGATSEYYKERDTGFNSWNNASSTSGGIATSASAGVPGGSWGQSVASQAREPAFGTPSVHVVSNPAATAAVCGATASADGSYEKNLILELCPPGGVKAVPPPDKLASFARSVQNLNSELICPVLLDFLEDGQPWIIRAKALCVMETAIQNGVVVSDGSNPYKTFFFACIDEIQPLAVHPRGAIAEPAKRVLRLLGVTPGPDARGEAAVAPPSTAPPPAPVVPNFLDFDDTVESSNPSVPSQPPAASQPPPVPPPQPSVAPSPGPPTNSSMFGGMTVKGGQEAAPTPPSSAIPAAAAPQPPPPPQQAAANLLDFSDPFSPSSTTTADPTAAATTTTTTTSMFGALNIKDEKKKEDDLSSVPAEAAAPTGSAFGFIQSTSAAAPAAPTQSFDPLQSVGGDGNTSSTSLLLPTGNSPSGIPKAVMALSTEQMQAMAYQQMMMQQQMQQMQMAAALMVAHGHGMPPSATSLPFRQTSGGGVGGPGVGFASPGGGGGAVATTGNKFYQPAKKDDKKFDFVKDAMVSAEKKK